MTSMLAERYRESNPDPLQGGCEISPPDAEAQIVPPMPEHLLRDGMWAYLRGLVQQLAAGSKSGFARQTGIARADLTDAYNGVELVSIGMLQRIAKALNKDASLVWFEVAKAMADVESGKVKLPVRPKPKSVAKRDVAKKLADSE